MKKIFVTVLSIICLLNFNITNIKADDEVILSLDNTKDIVPFERANMLPGDTETKTYKVKIFHDAKVTVFFDIEVTYESYNLGDYITLTIKDGDGNIIADKKNIKDFEEQGFDVYNGTDSLTFEITSYFDENYNNSSDYQSLPEDAQPRVEANIVWYVKDTGGMIIPSTGVDGLIEKANNIPFESIMLMMIAVCLIVILFVLLKKETIKNKVIKIAVISFVSLLIFVNTTYALYLARLEINNSYFTTRKYTIDINILNSEDKKEAVIITPIQEYFEPGRSRIAEFKLVNDGDIDVYYRLYLKENEVNDEKEILMNAMTIGIYLDQACTEKLFEIDGENFNQNHSFDNDKDILKAGKTKTFYMLLKMDEDAGNEYQESYSDFTIICEAIQSTNNSGGFN